jgi:hypothetical protein
LESPDAISNWRALQALMQRPWFSRRWVVQEIALAKAAIIYCGADSITWKDFAIAVELFVEVETATHRLSEITRREKQTQWIPGWFEHVSALGASLLVDATERLFKENKDETLIQEYETSSYISNEESDTSSEDDTSGESDLDTSWVVHQKPTLPWVSIPSAKNRPMQPLLSLEYLVSTLTIFETSVPHDTIYALLAIARDTTPRARHSDFEQPFSNARARLELFTQRKTYHVDYNLPYVDVCQEFIKFAIERSLQNDRSRALDVICRPLSRRSYRARKCYTKGERKRKM